MKKALIFAIIMLSLPGAAGAAPVVSGIARGVAYWDAYAQTATVPALVSNAAASRWVPLVVDVAKAASVVGAFAATTGVLTYGVGKLMDYCTASMTHQASSGAQSYVVESGKLGYRDDIYTPPAGLVCASSGDPNDTWSCNFRHVSSDSAALAACPISSGCTSDPNGSQWGLPNIYRQASYTSTPIYQDPYPNPVGYKIERTFDIYYWANGTVRNEFFELSPPEVTSDFFSQAATLVNTVGFHNARVRIGGIFLE